MSKPDYDIRELRIGNLLMFNGHTPAKVDIIELQSDGKGMVNYLDASDDDMFDAIPLTPELLEKCGFRKYRYSWSTSKQNTFNFEEWSNDGLGLYLHINDHKTGQHIKYLHQLQNLYFSLTGQELEINL